MSTSHIFFTFSLTKSPKLVFLHWCCIPKGSLQAEWQHRPPISPSDSSLPAAHCPFHESGTSLPFLFRQSEVSGQQGFFSSGLMQKERPSPSSQGAQGWKPAPPHVGSRTSSALLTSALCHFYIELL